MEKLLKGFINLKAWLLISVHIDETERIMRTQKSLLILHAVQQECLNVWICLCGLISFLNALGLEIEALTAVDRGIRSESLLGEDQVADLSGRGKHVGLLHIIGQNMKILQVDDISICFFQCIFVIGEDRILEGLRICVPCDTVVGIFQAAV